MNLVVKKFGGTSVSSISKIIKIADNVLKNHDSNTGLVIVL